MKLTINQKLILVYLSIFTVPSIFFSFVFFHNIKEQEEKDRFKAIQERSNQIESTVQKNGDLISNIEWYILQDYNLLDFISSNQKKTSMDYVNFNNDTIKNINQMMEMNQDIYQIRIFSHYDNSLEIWPHLYSEKHLQSTDFYSLLNNSKSGTYWRLNHNENHMVYNQDSNVSVVSFYRKIYYPAGNFVGILEIVMSAEHFWGLDNSETSLLQNQRGQQSRVLITGLDEDIKNRDYSSFLQNLSKEKATPYLQTVEDETFAISQTYIENLDTYVVNISDLSEYRDELNKKRNWTVTITILLLVAISFVTATATNGLMKKLSIITKYVNYMQEGNLDVEIPLDGRDEFGDLARSFNKMVRSIRELIAKIIKEETATQKAELGALQAQIDSHFFYNTLENIKMKAVIANQYELANDITVLGKIMRYNLNWKSNFVSLKDEIEHVKNYFAVVSIRNSGRFQLTIEVEDKYLNMRIHKMILQPLVENSVVHGLESRKSGKIVVKAYENEKSYCLRVEDDGIGFPQKIERGTVGEILEKVYTVHPKSNGIAIKNVYERLKLYYGDSAEIYIDSEPEYYTRITIEIDKDKVEL
ncbi:sensor histidine kinase [Scatolibacter rhodanostii]|uniref:sensor histidine kinase n=1 Tax=Scatolibacter rhodanostii TaxID=2014781 RepID=UPI000C077D12|nr:histidine kinase [Scatolibacter rhodanostii]